MKLRISFLSVACFTVFLSHLGAQSSYLLATIAGSDEAGDNGPATAALLVQAQGIAVDATGNVFVADADGHRIRRISTNGIITTVAGNGHPGFSGDGGPASAAQVNTPYGVAVDRSGNLFIADLGNARIRRISYTGVITTIAGGGTTPPAQADSRPAIDAALKAPRNVTTDAYGNIYFSDFGDHRVWQITAAGTLLRVAGTGVAGAAGDGGFALLAQLNSPAGLAMDAGGTLHIADSGNRRIRKIWRGVITTAGDTGKPGAAPAIPLGVPTGVAIDTDGSLIIADASNSQVLRVTPLMQITTLAQPALDVAIDNGGMLYTCFGPYIYRRPRNGLLTVAAGSGQAAFAGDGGPGLKARFQHPAGIGRDAAGSFWVADRDNQRIRKITADGTVFTVAGNGVAGMGGDGGPAVTARLNHPTAVLPDKSGNLYIADTGNNRIRRVDFTGTINTIAGTGESGFAGDNGLAIRARLNSPSGIALDADGNLYIADTGNHVIRQVSPDGVIVTIAGNANRAFSGDGGPALKASLDSPTAVAVDRYGNLFISDGGNGRIRRVGVGGVLGSGIMNTFPANDLPLWRSPQGIALDDAGRLFVADADAQRVFMVEATGRVTAIAGDGLRGFTLESAFGLAVRLDTPSSVTVDGTGAVFLTDSGNGRIRKLTPYIDVVPPPAVELPGTLVNAASLQPGAVAPGELVSLFGSQLHVEGQTTEVLFGGKKAPLFFLSSTQINLQVPETLAGLTAVDVSVMVGGTPRSRLTAGVVEAAPALFTWRGGTGGAAAVNEDGTLNSAENAAGRGSVVTLYATGVGAVEPVTVTMGGYSAEILYAGPAPGFAGLTQVNARVPNGFAPPGILPVSLSAGSASSQAGVTLAVR